MTRLMLATGVAALAITAPAASAPHGSHGNAAQQHKQQAQHGGQAKQDHGGQSKPQKAAKQDRQSKAQTHQAQRAPAKPAHAAQQQAHADRQAHQRAQAQARNDASTHQQRQVMQAQNTGQARAQAERQQMARRNEALGRNNAPVMTGKGAQQVATVNPMANPRVTPLAAQTRVDRIANRRDRRLAEIAASKPVRAADWNDLARQGVWLDGCPPGLAKKPVACIPPGQAKQLVGARVNTLSNAVALSALPQQLDYVYRETPNYYYRYGNGYVYQVNRANDVVSALMPLFGLGYTVGQQFPSAYPYYGLPSAYQPFYPTSAGYDYRYANGYVYQVNPYTGMVMNVDPMLGYGYGYGQMMPVTYSAYNVPYQYRPLYYDTSNSYYRYAPGAIYQVDPTTSLITAVAALLTNGMTVGQPMPAGYGVYNVPYAYRSNYYDTPNDWYRYSNGYIYRVDPATQLVTAIVASALT